MSSTVAPPSAITVATQRVREMADEECLPFDEIEAYIELLPFHKVVLDDLWLMAWAKQPGAVRERAILRLLDATGLARGDDVDDDDDDRDNGGTKRDH